MKRSKKLGYLLFYLILMLLFGTLIFTYYKVAPANFNFTGKTYEEIHRFIMTNEYWRLFSFWAAVVLGVISVLGFIIVCSTHVKWMRMFLKIKQSITY
ncbi:Uncharacterised protein [Weissella viridescens]|uniref:Uncharacterized protein n=1 Tax=Weissella viridescens TaxID=1629 RepID=A0A380P3V5_WEIVI|nr:Uncharacterised protein [Weissella viridescens]